MNYLLTMPLRKGHFRVLAVASMEQIIGAALSTLVGILIPMLALVKGSGMSGFEQGLTGAAGLVGISVGAPVIGRLGDRYGYLGFFRLCPVLIVAASLLIYFTASPLWLIIGLFIIGLGVGGGYSLDTAYISEIMPTKWKLLMLGVAKASCAIGFFGAAGVCWWILSRDPSPGLWNGLIWIIGALGVLTLLMRIPFRQSPVWLLTQGRTADAEKAARYFLGSDVEVKPSAVPSTPSGPKTSWADMFKGANLRKVIFSGVPWACEGVGVYGVGVFLPLLVMALGIDTSDATGMAKVLNSVELTTVINFFIVPGFVLGLFFVRKLDHVWMLTWGFVVAGAGLGLLLAAYLLHWPVWVSIAAFVVFEVSLNAGPHLVTFIIPAQVYSVEERAAGSGIASMVGKIGAILGVFFMPVLLKAGGISLVLIVCIAVMFAGAGIAAFYGPKVMPRADS